VVPAQGEITVLGAFAPTTQTATWDVGVLNNGGQSVGITADAVCVPDVPGNIQQVRLQVVVPNGASSPANVDCPAASTLVGGGNAVVVVGGVIQSAFVVASRPQGNGWQAQMANQSGQPRTLLVDALCYGIGPTAGGATSSPVSASTLVQPNMSGTANVSCPAGTVATGGGYFFEAGSLTSRVWLSELNNNGWRASAFNSLSLSAELDVFAVCTRF
jgi:hypothetical protein